MKVAVKYLITGLLFLIGITGVEAQVYFSADFSAAEGYANGPVVGQPKGASTVWEDANPDVPADLFVVENGALLINDATEGMSWVVMNIPVKQEPFSVSWDWQYTGDSTTVTDVGICLSDRANFELIDGNPVPNYNEQGSMMRMYTAGVVDVRNGDWSGGGAYETLTTFNYQDGKRFHVRMEIDPKAWTYDVYIQKEGDAAETKLAFGYGFRRLPTAETDGLNCIAIWHQGADAVAGGKCLLDNFMIYGPADVGNWAIY